MVEVLAQELKYPVNRLLLCFCHPLTL
jgi:hypothetical protein